MPERGVMKSGTAPRIRVSSAGYSRSMDPDKVDTTSDIRTTGTTGHDRALQALRLLADIADICNRNTGVSLIAEQVIRRTCEFNGWKEGRVYLARDAGGRSVNRVMHTTIAEYIESRDPDGGGARGSAESICSPEVIDAALAEASAEGKPVWRRVETEADARTLIIVFTPILIRGSAVGALEIISDLHEEPSATIRSAIESIAVQFGGVVERHRLNQTIVEGVGAEQERLGRHIHDTIGQELAGLAMSGQAVLSRYEESGVLDMSALRRVFVGLRETVERLGSLTDGLLPPSVLGHRGLQTGIERLASRVSGLHRVTCDLIGGFPEVPERMTRDIFLIVQEAVSNAVRHAEATAIEVRPSMIGRRLRVEVVDNGKGFTVESVASRERGLAIMRFRANALDGRVDIISAAGAGTKVVCEVPVVEEQDEEQGTE